MKNTDPAYRFISLALLLMLLVPFVSRAQDEEETELGWSNATDLSLVITEGNSSTESFGLKNKFRYLWTKARYTFTIDAVRTNTANDPIAVVNDDSDTGYDVVEFEKTLDVERYYVENRYDRSISERFFWHVGLTWDRNNDAGILSRWIGFAGVGNTWWDREDLRFITSYGLSYTNREEVNETPGKDETFPGFRFNWEYRNQWGKITTFENDWTSNVSLSDTNDWSSNMTTSLDVAMSTHLGLKISLQWLYNNEPALEDVDVIADVELMDPDGVPGSGDEFFITVDPGTGAELVLGEVSIRKKQLDTVFRTSLSIRF